MGQWLPLCVTQHRSGVRWSWSLPREYEWESHISAISNWTDKKFRLSHEGSQVGQGFFQKLRKWLRLYIGSTATLRLKAHQLHPASYLVSSFLPGHLFEVQLTVWRLTLLMSQFCSLEIRLTSTHLCSSASQHLPSNHTDYLHLNTTPNTGIARLWPQSLCTYPAFCLNLHSHPHPPAICCCCLQPFIFTICVLSHGALHHPT